MAGIELKAFVRKGRKFLKKSILSFIIIMAGCSFLVLLQYKKNE
jgi:hypothetical protein